MKKLLIILRMIYNGEVKPEYQRQIEFDISVYGTSFQWFGKFNLLERIYRRLCRLPLDRKRIDPRNIRRSQPKSKQIENYYLSRFFKK